VQRYIIYSVVVGNLMWKFSISVAVGKVEKRILDVSRLEVYAK